MSNRYMANSSSEHAKLQAMAKENFENLSDKQTETFSDYEVKNIDWRESDAGKMWLAGDRRRPDLGVFSKPTSGLKASSQKASSKTSFKRYSNANNNAYLLSVLLYTRIYIYGTYIYIYSDVYTRTYRTSLKDVSNMTCSIRQAKNDVTEKEEKDDHLPLLLLGRSEKFVGPKRDMTSIACALIADGKAREVEVREDRKKRKLEDAASGSGAAEKEEKKKKTGGRGRKKPAAAGPETGSE